MTTMVLLLRSFLVLVLVEAWAPSVSLHRRTWRGRQRVLLFQQLQQQPTDVVDDGTSTNPSNAAADTTTSITTPVVVVTIPEAVKLFGKLAEKYIVLDATGGMCCYSGCSDCEYREPGGGYRMADQSASRPKWVPTYQHRQINDKQHTSKWSTVIYNNDIDIDKDDIDSIVVESVTVVNKEQFVKAVCSGMTYAPILGGPNVAASAAAAIDETNAANRLFDILADGKDKLTKHRMSVRLKQFSDGEEGLTWPQFQKAMGVN